MVHIHCFPYIAAFLLLHAVSLSLCHGDEHGSQPADSGLDKASHLNSNSSLKGTPEQSYFAYPEYGKLMLAHIGLMTIAWFFVLPIGVMLSVARSRFALVVQLFFLGIHTIGLLLGAAYARKTPDLYQNDVHSKIGWIVTSIVLAQCVIGFLKLIASIKPMEVTDKDIKEPAFLPVSNEPLTQHEQLQTYRYSNDSGHFTASESSRTQSICLSPDLIKQEQQSKFCEYHGAQADPEADLTEKHGLLANVKVERFTSRVSALMSRRTIKMLDILNDTVNCMSLPLGFVAVVSGVVVYGGVFRGDAVFNGLAHSIKGGIFFWYGLLTLGRWMGCFVEVGWAWNVKPPAGVVSPRKARIPSAEFVESFVIFLYGASNVWLEHLAAANGPWSAQDLEHVSISILFFGGGLCGMLIESQKIRDFLNVTILMVPNVHGHTNSRELLAPPRTYQFSMNPFPALIILLLGIMMSSHHQSSVVSTTIHKQWGMLFVGFAIARAVTYMLTYISPPTSYLPSRPPSELVSSFCLISGGVIFIASNKDTVAAMEYHGLHAMFPFTVTMGLTAFLMAWVMIVTSVKGLVVRKEYKRP